MVMMVLYRMFEMHNRPLPNLNSAGAAGCSDCIRSISIYAQNPTKTGSEWVMRDIDAPVAPV